MSFVSYPVVEYVFLGSEEQNTLISLGLVIAIICVTIAMYPMLHKKIFDSDWIEAINTLNPKAFAKEFKELEDRDIADGFGLTPREKQIFTMMLTEMSVKQIMIELEISRGTFNFHTSNLYRKLDIQSRTELFARYSDKQNSPV